jgi:hypothetical protein
MKSFLKSKESLPYDSEPHEMKLPEQVKRHSINPTTLVANLSKDSNHLM